MLHSNESWLAGKDDAADDAFRAVRASRPSNNVAAQQHDDERMAWYDRTQEDDFWDAEFEKWLAQRKQDAA